MCNKFIYYKHFLFPDDGKIHYRGFCSASELSASWRNFNSTKTPVKAVATTWNRTLYLTSNGAVVSVGSGNVETEKGMVTETETEIERNTDAETETQVETQMKTKSEMETEIKTEAAAEAKIQIQKREKVEAMDDVISSHQEFVRLHAGNRHCVALTGTIRDG